MCTSSKFFGKFSNTDLKASAGCTAGTLPPWASARKRFHNCAFTKAHSASPGYLEGLNGLTVSRNTAKKFSYL